MKTWKFHTYFQEVSVKAKSCRTPAGTLQMFLRPLKLLKEKLLSSSTESSNLLQYVSDFCTKLFTACESAKANISSTQKSVEEKYDADIAERNFQPGLKVLALLPVPGNTLSCRFFVPYVIEKKLNDLSYTIVTPDKRHSDVI